jgi:ribosomal protein L11 methyltransferase
MESYNQIKVTSKTENREIVEAVMTAMDFIGGLMIEDFSDIEQCEWDYIDKELLEKDKTKISVSGFIAEGENILPVIEKLKLLLPENSEIEVISVAQDDWANNWKKYYKPMRVGKNIVIKPSWEDYDKKENDVVVELDPGMAFGTGTHETTRMCMAQLENYVDKDTEVLDVGCGSGILAITAMLLGAKGAVGVDLDPVAAQVAAENGKMNGFEPPRYVIKRGNLVDEIEGLYDVAVANIIADVIILLCNDVKKFIKENGVFICSGIILEREEDVKNALENAGYEIINTVHEGEWACIVSKIIK